MELSKNLIFSLSNLLRTNGGFFKSEKQAEFILSRCSDNEIVNHFTTFKNIARDHYHLDNKGVYRIERYTDKKGYVTTWERGQVHNLEARNKRDMNLRSEIEKNQIEKIGFTVESKSFYEFIDLYNEIKSNTMLKLMAIKDLSSDDMVSALAGINEYCEAVEGFKKKFFDCTV